MLVKSSIFSNFQKSKRQEIESTPNCDLKSFEKLGLLLDTEADFITENGHENSSDNPALVQIFSRPFFEGKDTFFLEVLERKGARGFGAGNISALAKSIQIYQQECRENNK